MEMVLMVVMVVIVVIVVIVVGKWVGWADDDVW